LQFNVSYQDDAGWHTLGGTVTFSVTPKPTPTEPTPTLDTSGDEGKDGSDAGNADKCEDNLGGWIECNILQP